MSRDDRFAATMIREIRRSLAKVARIHVSGDFHDANYTRKWAEVARSCANTAFFAYTRSWRSDAVLAELIGLARFPNVSLGFSEDRDSGRPPAASRFRQAYLLANGQPEASVPADADLVFRVPLARRPGRLTSYSRPAKRANGVLICPKEQGIARRVEMTCSTCRICFTDRRPRHKI